MYSKDAQHFINPWWFHHDVLLHRLRARVLVNFKQLMARVDGKFASNLSICIHNALILQTTSAIVNTVRLPIGRGTYCCQVIVSTRDFVKIFLQNAIYSACMLSMHYPAGHVRLRRFLRGTSFTLRQKKVLLPLASPALIPFRLEQREYWYGG